MIQKFLCLGVSESFREVYVSYGRLLGFNRALVEGHCLTEGSFAKVFLGPGHERIASLIHLSGVQVERKSRQKRNKYQ